MFPNNPNYIAQKNINYSRNNNQYHVHRNMQNYKRAPQHNINAYRRNQNQKRNMYCNMCGNPFFNCSCYMYDYIDPICNCCGTQFCYYCENPLYDCSCYLYDEEEDIVYEDRTPKVKKPPHQNMRRFQQ